MMDMSELLDPGGSPEPPKLCELQRLRGHRGPVLRVVFSHDGQHCLSCSQDKCLRLWNPHKGTAIKEYSGIHNHEVYDAAILSDKSRFVSVGGDKAGFLWDVATGKVIRKFVAHTGKINCVTSASGDSVVLTGSYDKQLHLWDLRATQNRRPMQTMEEAMDAITCVLCTDDEVIASSVDGFVRTYDIRMGRLYCDHFRVPVSSIALTTNGDCLLASCLDSSLRLVDRRNKGRQLNTYRGHNNANYRLQATVDPTDTFVISGSEDGRVLFWEIDTPKARNTILEWSVGPPSTLPHGNAAVFSVQFAPKASPHVMVTTGNDRTLAVFGAESST